MERGCVAGGARSPREALWDAAALANLQPGPTDSANLVRNAGGREKSIPPAAVSATPSRSKYVRSSRGNASARASEKK